MRPLHTFTMGASTTKVLCAFLAGLSYCQVLFFFSRLFNKEHLELKNETVDVAF